MTEWWAFNTPHGAADMCFDINLCALYTQVKLTHERYEVLVCVLIVSVSSNIVCVYSKWLG